MLKIYGTRALDVIALIEGEPALGTPVGEVEGLTAAEVCFALQQEQAMTLCDVVARRIMTGLSGDLGLSSLEAVAEAAARHAGWSDDQTATELAAYRTYVQKFTPNPARRRTTQS